MLNYVLFALLGVSVLCGFFTGNAGQITSAFSDGSVEAVKLCINMGAVVAFWSGIMKVAEKSGLSDKIAYLIAPFMKFLFPKSFSDPQCRNAITMNVTSNLLGLGNAATPMGIKAIRCMYKRSGELDKEIVRFMVINCASLQILPTTVAAIRNAGGSKNAFDILVPVWIVSALTLIFSIILGEICSPKPIKSKNEGVRVQ